MAREKDGGFNVNDFADRLDRVATFTDDEFRVPAAQVPDVRAAVARWKLQLRLLAREQPDPGRELGRNDLT